ncbi:MAG: MoaD/ThiS family protein [Haliscomenobacter sp.]
MQKSVQVLAFGIARDIIGTSTLSLPFSPDMTVASLRMDLLQQYPALGELNALAFAINSAYAQEEQSIAPGDEVALIPPVSGG